MDCVFCSKKIERGTGFIHVTRAGKALGFCSRKCRKNMLKLERKPRKVKWTKAYREEKQIRVRSIVQYKKDVKEEDKKDNPVKKETKKKVKAKTKNEHADTN
jgi:large subunit ribosomal protein L24e